VNCVSIALLKSVPKFTTRLPRFDAILSSSPPTPFSIALVVLVMSENIDILRI
jgi:hypothetical protein